MQRHKETISKMAATSERPWD